MTELTSRRNDRQDNGFILGISRHIKRLFQAWMPSENRQRLFFSLLLLILLLVSLAALGIGAVPISLKQTLAIIASQLGMGAAGEYSSTQEMVLNSIRAPRVLLAILVGASLAVSGAVMQGLFRNPLADPALIGVSSGAALAAVTVIVLGGFLPSGIAQHSITYVLPVAAFIGGVLASLLVYRFATAGGATDVATMLLAGIAVTAIAGAGLGMMVFIADDSELRTLTFWTMGSLGGVTWNQLLFAIPFMLIPIFLLPSHASFLNAMLLGEAEAGHLGFELQRAKLLMILLVASAVGAAVSLSGVIGFVGLVVPHLVRLVMGPDHRFLIPASAVLGAIILLLADLLARTIVAPAELPIGIITAILGGPFFLWLLGRRRMRNRF